MWVPVGKRTSVGEEDGFGVSEAGMGEAVGELVRSFDNVLVVVSEDVEVMLPVMLLRASKVY